MRSVSVCMGCQKRLTTIGLISFAIRTTSKSSNVNLKAKLLNCAPNVIKKNGGKVSRNNNNNKNEKSVIINFSYSFRWIINDSYV